MIWGWFWAGILAWIVAGANAWVLTQPDFGAGPMNVIGGSLAFVSGIAAFYTATSDM